MMAKETKIVHMTSVRGFTLVELAAVLVVAALLIAMAASVAATRIEVQRVKVTHERLAFILNALDEYVRSYDHLPCPASGVATIDLPNYGWGGGTNTGTCVDQDFTAPTDNIEIGTVPFNTLELPASTALDGWNRRFTYVVDEDITDVTGYTANTPGINLEIATGDKMLNSGDEITTEAAVMIISHGPNGFGAWLGKGTNQVTPTNGGGTSEDENADNDALFIQIMPTGESGTAFYSDDIVWYKHKWQLAQ